MKTTFRVLPLVKAYGQRIAFVGVVFRAGVMVALTIPANDRNEAARRGAALASIA